MHRIWHMVLEPVLRAVRPRVIVESGSNGAQIHRYLLEYCAGSESALHSVQDPDDALDGGTPIDLVVLAQEPTWHHVSGLLDRIDEWRSLSGEPFPVLIINGARESRYEVTSNGARTEESGLVAAIRAFVAGSSASLEFVSVPVLGGVGFLFPHEIRERIPVLSTILDGLAFLADMENEERERLAADRAAIARRDERIAELERDKENLLVWFEELAGSTRQILNSKRWRMGNAFAEFQRRLLLKRRKFRGHLDSRVTIDQFKQWKSGDLEFPESRRTAVLGMRTHSDESEPPDLTALDVSVDVVICVHNALDDVRACIESVLRSKTPVRHRLILVNDGSDRETTGYLRQIDAEHAHVELLDDGGEAAGYTRAANRGLRESGADYVILLNSDTVVPKSWIEGIVECGESDPRIGIIGPLSNAATWQSVPDLNHDGKWAVNDLPHPEGVGDSAELIRLLSSKSFPRMPFLNGFCYTIKRKVLQSVGYLDEQAFPKGYGEEDDYSFRTRRAGFHLAVADHVFVHHKKSKSYGTARRDELAQNGQRTLRKRYSKERLDKDSKWARGNQALRKMRERVRIAGESLRFEAGVHAAPPSSPHAGRGLVPGNLPPIVQAARALRITYVLPSLRIRGGVLSVVQIVNGLVRLGVDARLVVRSGDPETLNWHFAREPLFLIDDDELREHFPESDIVVATHWTTVDTAVEQVERGRAAQSVYYIQDYESWFYPESDKESRTGVIESYDRITDKIVTSEWIRGLLEQHGHAAAKIPIGVNLDQFYPRQVERCARPRVLAYTRFETPRRGFVHVIETLRRLVEADPEIEVVLFGEDLSTFTIPFPHLSAGVVSDPGCLADLYSSSDVFFDGSNFQSCGRPALEAMACGTPCVMTRVGGVNEYAVHDQNCRLVSPGDPDAAAFEIIRVLSDPALGDQLRQEGFRTVEQLDMRDEAIRTLGHLHALTINAPKWEDGAEPVGHTDQGQAPGVSPEPA